MIMTKKIIICIGLFVLAAFHPVADADNLRDRLKVHIPDQSDR